VSRGNLRNLAIVVGIALVITFVSTAAFAAAILGRLLSILLLAGFIWFGYVMWRENRTRISYMPTRERTILYAASALLALLLVGSLVFNAWSGLSSIAFLVLIGGLAFVIWKVWQDAQRYY
jgi:hypothetical protein